MSAEDQRKGARRNRRSQTALDRDTLAGSARKDDSHEDEICIVRAASVRRFYDCLRATSVGQLQPQPELLWVSHLCLGSNNANQIQNSILAQVAQQDIDTAMQGKGFAKVTESQTPAYIGEGFLRYRRNQSLLSSESSEPLNSVAGTSVIALPLVGSGFEDQVLDVENAAPTMTGPIIDSPGVHRYALLHARSHCRTAVGRHKP